MVFVPRLPLNDTVLGVTGVPRAAPSDLVVALLSRVVPGDVVQDLVLLLIIVVAGWGAGRLVSRSVVGAIAAAALYSWNPYLSEHLLLGQWAILLGYAALPWIAAAALDLRVGQPRAAARLVCWLGLAAVGGASSEFLAALVAVPVLAWPRPGARDRFRHLAGAGLALVVLALPWLIPALTNPGSTPSDHVGATVFASRADTPFGALGSLLSLGGVWNTTAVPPGRSHWYAALAALVVTAVALWGLAGWRRDRGFRPTGGLLLAGGLSLALALWSCVPGLDRGLRWLAAHSQAFDLLRDGQRSLAPFVLLIAIGWGSAVAALASRAKQAAALAAVPVLILPAAAWGVSGALVAVDWPHDWSTVAAAARSLPSGPVLVLPWASVRAFAWNDNRPMTDPADRWLERRTVGDGRLLVRSSSGSVLATPQEDPLARRIGTAAAGTGALTQQLRSFGYAGVLVERDAFAGDRQASRLAGCRLAAQTSTLALYEVPNVGRPAAVETGSVTGTVVGDAVALLVVIISMTICAFWPSRRTRSV